MFDGVLKLAPQCDVCGASFEKADVGDGASVFVMFIVGFLAVTLYLLIEVAVRPPWWGHLIFQIPFIPVASVLLLRPIKGILFALQFAHDAEEARLDE